MANKKIKTLLHLSAIVAIQSNATVIIYMGMRKLEEIIATYTNAGKGDTPAAVIQHASLPQRKVVKGKV